MKIAADLHVHLSGKAPLIQTAQEILFHAQARGLEAVALTDHLPKTSNIHCAWSQEDQDLLSAIDAPVRLLCGAEADIADLSGTLLADQADLAHSRLTVAALHPYCVSPRDAAAHTAAFAVALENPFVDILAHPMDTPYPFEEEKLVLLAARLGKPLELNALSARNDPICAQAQKRLALLAKKYGAPLVVSSDAQKPEQIGDFGDIPNWLDELEIPQQLVLNSDMRLLDDYLFRRSFVRLRAQAKREES